MNEPAISLNKHTRQETVNVYKNTESYRESNWSNSLIPFQQCPNSNTSLALEDFLKCLLQISCSHARVNKRSKREQTMKIVSQKDFRCLKS